MKDINIIDGQIRADQQSVHRWFWRSAILLGLLSTGLIAFSIQEYMRYVDLSNEHAELKSGTSQLHACLERKRQLKEQAALLQAQSTKINTIKYRPKNPVGIFDMLHDLSSDIMLQEISLKKKKLDLILLAHDTKALLEYADRLRAHEMCAQIEIASIEQTDDRVKAVLHVVLR